MSIASEIQRLQTAKANIKTAIENKGVTVPSSAKLDVYDDYVLAISSKEAVSWHQCPELPRNFVANVTYNPNDYTTTQITNYAPATAVSSNTKPIGKTIDGTTFYNEIPNEQTPFSTTNKAGTLTPLDQVRWLNTNTFNVRDLGGWDCDGGTVKYGRLIRGGEANASDKDLMVNEIGIRFELNLRGSEAEHRDYSVWGVEYAQFDEYHWYSISNKELWRKELRVIFDAVKYDKPLFFHCQGGADRTGTLACVLEAILGVSQSDIDKDYELTTFAYGTSSAEQMRARNESDWVGLITAIKNVSLPTGVVDTFTNHAIYFVASLGFTADEINEFRSKMIEGTPSEITLALSSYSVTKNAQNVTFDNTISSVNQYQPYKVNVEANSGYAISSVQVLMGGVDITNQVFEGVETNLYNSVKNTLTHCSTNNQKDAIINGQSYGAVITVEDGYTLEGARVSITMNGVDITNQVWQSCPDE